jgi:hypothetical protein
MTVFSATVQEFVTRVTIALLVPHPAQDGNVMKIIIFAKTPKNAGLILTAMMVIYARWTNALSPTKRVFIFLLLNVRWEKYAIQIPENVFPANHLVGR